MPVGPPISCAAWVKVTAFSSQSSSIFAGSSEGARASSSGERVDVGPGARGCNQRAEDGRVGRTPLRQPFLQRGENMDRLAQHLARLRGRQTGGELDEH
ncbi:MAG TPA: hypothetical protein VLR47_08390, partial [Rhodospirillales bacterium]|nr:hypothetical protein [Rhodospirillales bacterium]